MHKVIWIFVAAGFAAMSCTKDKTDYEAEIDDTVTDYYEFEEAGATQVGGYTLSIEALNGTFYKGYNEIRLKITDHQTNKAANAAAVTLLPIRADAAGNNSSCPHRYDMVPSGGNDGYFSGYSVFTNESSADGQWTFYISFTIANETHTVAQHIAVQKQPNRNLNMTSFTGHNGARYFIALVAPQRPQVAENELIAGIYKYNAPLYPPSGNFPDPSQFSYSEADDYTLLLDPRMPEPSMGNHSSPNNKDLNQQSDGLYHGIVNYTMTGNWTLNFILLDHNGETVKGTDVPSDFTPGVEGVKSELHIDILF